jgi:hypothetical protein
MTPIHSSAKFRWMAALVSILANSAIVNAGETPVYPDSPRNALVGTFCGAPIKVEGKASPTFEEICLVGRNGVPGKDSFDYFVGIRKGETWTLFHEVSYAPIRDREKGNRHVYTLRTLVTEERYQAFFVKKVPAEELPEGRFEVATFNHPEAADRDEESYYAIQGKLPTGEEILARLAPTYKVVKQD